jgi:eukaryotic-like serine/threonine-protein kinase
MADAGTEFASSESVRAGTRLGKYRLVAELGHGGMADVYLAVVEGPSGCGFAKLAVVKRLRSNYAEDPDFVAMLMDEARITSRLQHPNVVQLFEVDHDNGEYFLAIEYLDGQPLSRIAKRAAKLGSPLPESSHLIVILDALRGLHYAHELADYTGAPLGIVHRDMTPHNLFVTYDGHVKVMDFGVAKASGRSTETKAGIVKGKIRYMPAEQALGKDVDRRADVFSVGIMLWQALTGQSFWRDVDDMAIVHHLVHGDYVASPKAIRADVPEALDAICKKALALRAEDRYATAEEMASDIEAYLGASAVQARRQLAASVRELFANEAVRVRKVLEGLGKFETTLVPTPTVETPSSPILVAALPLRTPESLAPVALQQLEPPSVTHDEQVRQESSKRAWLAAAAASFSLLVGVALAEQPSPTRLPHRAAHQVASEVSSLVTFGPSRVAQDLGFDGEVQRIVIVREVEAPAAVAVPIDSENTTARPAPESSASEPPTIRYGRGAKPAIDSADPWAQGPSR